MVAKSSSKSSINTSLTFKVGKVLYATHTDTVQNVISNPSTTSISNASRHSKGTMYLGKTDLPVIDFRSKLGPLVDGVVRVMFSFGIPKLNQRQCWLVHINPTWFRVSQKLRETRQRFLIQQPFFPI